MAGLRARPASHPPRSTATRRLLAVVCAAGIAASLVLGAIAAAPVLRAADGTDPLLYVLQALAEDAGTSLVVGDTGVGAEADPLGDVGTDRGYDDITSASIASIPAVPAWLLEAFDCEAPNVACSPAGSQDSSFSGGALVVGQRMDGPPALLPEGERGEWGPILALDQYPTAPIEPGDPFAGASHAVITRVEGDQREVLAFAFVDDAFTSVPTGARSMWVGDDLLTLIPVDEELLTPPVGWDVYAFSSDGSAIGRDTIRGLDGAPLLALTGSLAEVTFEEAAASAGASPSGPPSRRHPLRRRLPLRRRPRTVRVASPRSPHPRRVRRAARRATRSRRSPASGTTSRSGSRWA